MKKVLIVEDEKSLREALSTFLSKNGFNTKVALDGDEGVELARSFKPEVILLDVLMPNKNGVEALRELRSDEETKEIPVIILSNLSLNETQTIKSVLKDKPEYYLLKTDWSLEEIKEKILSVLK